VPELPEKRLFVAMPYGSREGQLDTETSTSKSVTIKFDEVWSGILRPAIPKRFKCKRADELRKPGLIDQLYNQWLLDADVVLADLTLGNPNVFYELGIRQALSKRGTVLVAHLGTKLPFDVRNQVVLHYDAFDAASLLRFQGELREAIETAASHELDSPVHVYLPGLFVKRFGPGEDPERTAEQLRARIDQLTVQLATATRSAEDDRLYRQITDTLDSKRLVALSGIVLNSPVVGIQVLEELGIRLRRVGRLNDSLAVLKKAEVSRPNDPILLRELGFIHRKLGHFAEAEVYFKRSLHQNSRDPELQGMIGGLLKRKRLFEEALAHYQQAYELFNDDIYAIVNLGAINAILGHKVDADHFYSELLRLCKAKIDNGSADHWTYLCLGESQVHAGDHVLATRAYGNALRVGAPIEDVRSASEQLELLIEFNVQSDVAKEVLNSILGPVVGNS
jgi:Flp pilus assembly protein TadD